MPLSAWPLNATGGLVTQDGSSHVVRHMASEGLVTYSSPSCPLLAAFKHSPVRVGGPHLTPTRYLRLRLVRLVCPAASILYRYPIPGRRLRPRQGTAVGAPGTAQLRLVSPTVDSDRRPNARSPPATACRTVGCRLSRLERAVWCVCVGASGGGYVRCVSAFDFRAPAAAIAPSPRGGIRVLIASRYRAHYNFTPLNSNSLRLNIF